VCVCVSVCVSVKKMDVCVGEYLCLCAYQNCNRPPMGSSGDGHTTLSVNVPSRTTYLCGRVCACMRVCEFVSQICVCVCLCLYACVCILTIHHKIFERLVLFGAFTILCGVCDVVSTHVIQQKV
jgi:hypothetical protein